MLKGNARLLTSYEKLNFDTPEFRYFVRKELIHSKCQKYNATQDYFLCLRSITSSTNERTVIAAILPKVGIANSINIVLPASLEDTIYLLGAFNSFVVDFVAFTKVGNQNLNIFIIKQLPIPLKENLLKIDKKGLITSKVLRLSYTSSEIQSFATNFKYSDSPVLWNDKERFILQCELDAIYAHLYRLTRDDLEYIMETFPIVKRKDIAKHGTFHTKDTILRFYEEYAWTGKELD